MEDLLNPFNAFESCPACGGGLYDRQVIYCEATHVRGIAVLGSTRYAQVVAQQPVAHLHVRCLGCRYEWLERLRESKTPET